MKRHKPKVYKKHGYWWVQWASPNGFISNTYFDTDYNGAQWFANMESRNR